MELFLSVWFHIFFTPKKHPEMYANMDSSISLKMTREAHFSDMVEFNYGMDK